MIGLGDKCGRGSHQSYLSPVPEVVGSENNGMLMRVGIYALWMLPMCTQTRFLAARFGKRAVLPGAANTTASLEVRERFAMSENRTASHSEIGTASCRKGRVFQLASAILPPQPHYSKCRRTCETLDSNATPVDTSHLPSRASFRMSAAQIIISGLARTG
jgi:hypothetical protein